MFFLQDFRIPLGLASAMVFFCPLHRALIDNIEVIGSLPSAVDSLLRDGERRSVLEQEFDKFRSEYADQSDEIHVLNEKIGRVRKERNERHSVSGFAHKIPLRRRPYVFPARYQDVEWREPYTLVKMFFGTDFRVIFLRHQLDLLGPAVHANHDRIRQARSNLVHEQMELFELEDRIDELKKQLAAEHAPTVAKAMKRLERRLLGGPPVVNHRPIEPMNLPWHWQRRFPRPEPRRVREPLPELPLLAAARASATLLALSQSAPVARPLEVLQPCLPVEGLAPVAFVPAVSPPAAAQTRELAAPIPRPQEVPVLFHTPAPEPSHFCLPISREIEMVDVEDLVDEEPLSMSMYVDEVTLDNDVDMADAPQQPFSPPQRFAPPTIPTHPAQSLVPPMFSLSLGPPTPVPTTFASTGPRQSIGVTAPVPSFVPPPLSAAPQDTAMEVAPVSAVGKLTQIVDSFWPAASAQPTPPPAAAVLQPTAEIPAVSPSAAARPGLSSSCWAVPPTAPPATDAKVDATPVVFTAAEVVANWVQPVPTPEPVVSQDPLPRQQQPAGPSRMEEAPAPVLASHPAAQVVPASPAPTPVVGSFPSPAPADSEAPANSNEQPPKTALDAFYKSLEVQDRPIAKPKSRKAKLVKGQLPFAMTTTPSSVPSTSSLAFQPLQPVTPPPKPSSSSMVIPLSPPPAPIKNNVWEEPPTKSKDKGKGKATPRAAPASPPPPAPKVSVGDDDYFESDFEGDYLRTLCEEWISSCEVFLRTSPLCDSVRNAWIDRWAAQTRKDLERELGPDADARLYAHDETSDLVKVFFMDSLRRPRDGQDVDVGAKNAVLEHLSDAALEKDLNLGLVKFPT